VARNISLESPHHPSDTGQDMESIGHVVPKLFHFKWFQTSQKSSYRT